VTQEETLHEHQRAVDYTILHFRETFSVTDDIEPYLKKVSRQGVTRKEWTQRWSTVAFKLEIKLFDSTHMTSPMTRDELLRRMKLVNPKYSLREWFCCVRISKQASAGNYALSSRTSRGYDTPLTQNNRKTWRRSINRLKRLLSFSALCRHSQAFGLRFHMKVSPQLVFSSPTSS